MKGLVIILSQAFRDEAHMATDYACTRNPASRLRYVQGWETIIGRNLSQMALGKISLQSTRSGGREQFLPLYWRAKAGARGVFFTDTGSRKKTTFKSGSNVTVDCYLFFGQDPIPLFGSVFGVEQFPSLEFKKQYNSK